MVWCLFRCLCIIYHFASVRSLNEYLTPALDDQFSKFQITDSIPLDGVGGAGPSQSAVSIKRFDRQYITFNFKGKGSAQLFFQEVKEKDNEKAFTVEIGGGTNNDKITIYDLKLGTIVAQTINHGVTRDNEFRSFSIALDKDRKEVTVALCNDPDDNRILTASDILEYSVEFISLSTTSANSGEWQFASDGERLGGCKPGDGVDCQDTSLKCVETSGSLLLGICILKSGKVPPGGFGNGECRTVCGSSSNICGDGEVCASSTCKSATSPVADTTTTTTTPTTGTTVTSTTTGSTITSPTTTTSPTSTSTASTTTTSASVTTERTTTTTAPKTTPTISSTTASTTTASQPATTVTASSIALTTTSNTLPTTKSTTTSTAASTTTTTAPKSLSSTTGSMIFISSTTTTSTISPITANTTGTNYMPSAPTASTTGTTVTSTTTGSTITLPTTTTSSTSTTVTASSIALTTTSTSLSSSAMTTASPSNTASTITSMAPVSITTASFDASKSEDNSESNNGIDLATVAGATVGGLTCLAALGGGVYMALSRTVCNRVSPLGTGRQREDDEEEDDRHSTASPDAQDRPSSREELLPGSTNTHSPISLVDLSFV